MIKVNPFVNFAKSRSVRFGTFRCLMVFYSHERFVSIWDSIRVDQGRVIVIKELNCISKYNYLLWTQNSIS